MTDHYAAAGVNVALEGEFSSIAGELCRSTFGNNRYLEVVSHGTHFRGRKMIVPSFDKLPKGTGFDASADGIGTISILVDAADKPQTAGYNLMAMCAMDITRFGGLPALMLDVLDLKHLGLPGSVPAYFQRGILEGLKLAADESNVVLYRGETAQLRDCIDSEITGSITAFNIGGAVVGFANPNLMITGEMEIGMPVMALMEKSLGSNGISLVRSAFRYRYGSEWWSNTNIATELQQAAAPCTLYDRFLTTINGWYSDNFQPTIKVAAIAHITGGGFREKFGEDLLFPQGLSADLHSLFPPPPILREIVEWIGEGSGQPMTDEDIYQTFCAGQRALVVLEDRDRINEFVELAGQFGLTAKYTGSIIKEDTPVLRINSKVSGRTFDYRPK